MITGITFNGTDLTTVSSYVSFIYRDIHDLATRTLIDYKRARTDGHAFVSVDYEQRTLTLLGIIAAPTRDAFGTARDTLLAACQGKNGILIIPESGGNRQFNATMTNLVMTDKEGGGFDAFTLTFTMSDPFGYATSATVSSLGTYTASPTTYTPTFLGSYDAVPAITLTVNSFTGSGLQSITMTDPNTGRAQTVTRVWTAGDVVIFDTKNKQVTVNGIVTQWSGALLSWPVGAGSITFTDTFTARNITASLSQIPRYA